MSLTVFRHVVIGFVHAMQFCQRGGAAVMLGCREGGGQDTDLRGKERKKVNYTFVFSATSFSFLLDRC